MSRVAAPVRRAAAPVGRAAAPALAAAALLFALGCAGARGTAPVTLRFWAMGREGEVVQELVRDFERENPGVRVTVQQLPWTAAHEKLLTAFVGRSTPDVAQLGNTWIAEFAALRALEGLDRWIAASDVRPDSFFAGIWDTNVVDGVPYGVPWYVDTRVLFYRRDLLERAGYRSMPTTWDEWRRAMVALKRLGGKDAYAILLPANEWPPPMILGMQAGSPLVEAGGTRGAFRRPEFRRAFEFYVGLFRDGLAPPITNTQIANLYQEFERGYFAMYITGPWNIGEFRRRLPPEAQDTWSTAPLPGPGGDSTRLSMAGGSSLVMFRGSRHKREAWRLMEFLQRPEQQSRFFQLTGDLPARIEAWNDSTLLAEPAVLAFREQLLRVAPWPKIPEIEEIAIRLQDYAERAIRGATRPDSALAALDHDVDLILEKRRWLVEHGLAAGVAR